jgi:hypothetical protein
MIHKLPLQKRKNNKTALIASKTSLKILVKYKAIAITVFCNFETIIENGSSLTCGSSRLGKCRLFVTDGSIPDS